MRLINKDAAGVVVRVSPSRLSIKLSLLAFEKPTKALSLIV